MVLSYDNGFNRIKLLQNIKIFQNCYSWFKGMVPFSITFRFYACEKISKYYYFKYQN